MHLLNLNGGRSLRYVSAFLQCQSPAKKLEKQVFAESSDSNSEISAISVFVNS